MGNFVVKERDQLCHPRLRAGTSTRRGGFTLMELMVYIAIVGIVVIVAGQAYSNSTKMRIRTQSMLKASEVAENVAVLFKQDVAQTGAKSSMEAGVADGGSMYGNKFRAVNDSVYMHPVDAENPELIDSSSYKIEQDANGQSRLTLRRVRYNENGWYQAIEEIRWFVEDNRLKRTCLVIAVADGATIDNCAPKGTADTDDALEPYTIEMAADVNSFTVTSASPIVSEDATQVFPHDDLKSFRLIPRSATGQYSMFTSVNANDTTVELSDFKPNYNVSSESLVDESERKINQAFAITKKESTTETAWANLCTNYGALSLGKDTTYEISFEMPWEEDYSRSFIPGSDHMAVGFRDIGTGDFLKRNGKKILDDFLFFPPVTSDGAGKRTMRFTLDSTVTNVCLAFTFACYSPLVSQGKIAIQNLKIRKVPSAGSKFDGSEPSPNDRKNVKALRLALSIKRNGEEGAASVVVPIPSNGPSD